MSLLDADERFFKKSLKHHLLSPKTLQFFKGSIKIRTQLEYKPNIREINENLLSREFQRKVR